MRERRYIMIGAPTHNVRSPKLLETHFGERGIAARVETRQVEPGDLDAFMGEAKADRAVDGLLVTMPHKKAVIPHLEAISPVSELVGSVNTIKRMASGNFAGTQFDGAALVNALRAAEVRLDSARVLLLGVGGAGLAITQAIAAHGCGHLAIADLDARLVDAALRVVENSLVDRAATSEESYDLLINATPLGMKEGDPSPFDGALVAKAAAVADIVADPARTRLEALAKEAGTIFVSGRDMVKGQIVLMGDWLLSGDLG